MHQAEIKPKGGLWRWLTLFTSSSTLLCCALPITLTTLGMGAVSATLFSKIPVISPFLKTLARYENWVFGFSFFMISFGFWSVFRKGRACPADPELGAACARADTWNKRFLFLSALIWIVGFSARYLSVLFV